MWDKLLLPPCNRWWNRGLQRVSDLTKVIRPPNQRTHHWLQVCTPVAKPYWQPATWLFRSRPTCIILHGPAFPSLALLHYVYECVSQPRFCPLIHVIVFAWDSSCHPLGQPPTLVTKLTCKPPGHTWVWGSRRWPSLSGGGEMPSCNSAALSPSKTANEQEANYKKNNFKSILIRNE